MCRIRRMPTPSCRSRCWSSPVSWHVRIFCPPDLMPRPTSSVLHLHLHHIHSGCTFLALLTHLLQLQMVQSGCWLRVCFHRFYSLLSCYVCAHTHAAVEREARVASDDALRSASASEGQTPNNRCAPAR